MRYADRDLPSLSDHVALYRSLLRGYFDFSSKNAKYMEVGCRPIAFNRLAPSIRLDDVSCGDIPSC
jgi:hypothetical protein